MTAVQLKEKQRFDAHLQRLVDRAYPVVEDGFDRELAKLRRVDEDVRSNLDEFYTASLGSSMAKNRFADVKPNEGTIVRLSATSLSGDGTYINANYIDARGKFNVPFVYIATQAPMKNTILDFWRMVYENDSAFLIMLCAVKENGKGKSETYWPPRGETYDMGFLAITTLSESMRQESIYRRFLLRSVRGDEKEVCQMQYVGWPDQGVPQSSATLMEMIQTMAKSPRSTQAPIVVHCSGGVGRTGVLIGMHIALAQFQLGQTNISVPRIVRYMKACRSGMVRRKDQYLFLYYAVQREMERMILSEKTGVNLLEGRPRLRAAPLPFSGSAPSSAPMATPLIMAMPPPGSGSRHRLSIRDRFGSSSPPAGTEPGAAVPHANTSRNTDVDAAAMEDYLLRAGSLASHPRSPLATSAPPARVSLDAVPVPSAVVMDTFRASHAISVPRGPPPATIRSNVSQISEMPSPAHRPSSSLQEELRRQQHANRLKRFSPSADAHSAPPPSSVAAGATEHLS